MDQPRPLDKGISGAGIGSGVRSCGPSPHMVGPGAAGAAVRDSLRAKRPRGGRSVCMANRAERRTEVAGV